MNPIHTELEKIKEEIHADKIRYRDPREMGEDISRLISALECAVEALEYYTQYPSPFIVPDSLWDQGLRSQTKGREATDKVSKILRGERP